MLKPIRTDRNEAFLDLNFAKNDRLLVVLETRRGLLVETSWFAAHIFKVASSQLEFLETRRVKGSVRGHPAWGTNSRDQDVEVNLPGDARVVFVPLTWMDTSLNVTGDARSLVVGRIRTVSPTLAYNSSVDPMDSVDASPHRPDVQLSSADPTAMLDLYLQRGMKVVVKGQWAELQKSGYSYQKGRAFPAGTPLWMDAVIDMKTPWFEDFPLAKLLLETYGNRPFDPQKFLSNTRSNPGLWLIVKESLRWFADRPRDVRIRGLGKPPSEVEIELTPAEDGHVCLTVDYVTEGRQETRLVPLAPHLDDAPVLDLVVEGKHVVTVRSLHLPYPIQITLLEGAELNAIGHFSIIDATGEDSTFVICSANDESRLIGRLGKENAKISLSGVFRSVDIEPVDPLTIPRVFGSKPTEIVVAAALGEDLRISSHFSSIRLSDPQPWDVRPEGRSIVPRSSVGRRTLGEAKYVGNTQPIISPVASGNYNDIKVEFWPETNERHVVKTSIDAASQYDPRKGPEDAAMRLIYGGLLRQDAEYLIVPKSAVPASGRWSDAHARAIEYEYLLGNRLVDLYGPDAPLPNDVVRLMAHAFADLYSIPVSGAAQLRWGEGLGPTGSLEERSLFAQQCFRGHPNMSRFFQEVLHINPQKFNWIDLANNIWSSEIMRSNTAGNGELLLPRYRHNDPSRSNTLLVLGHSGQRKVGLLDFENMSIGDISWDISRTFVLQSFFQEQCLEFLDVLQERGVFSASQREFLEVCIRICKECNDGFSLGPDLERFPVWVANNPSEFEQRVMRLEAEAEVVARVYELSHDWRALVPGFLTRGVEDYLDRSARDELTPSEKVIGPRDPDRLNLREQFQESAHRSWKSPGASLSTPSLFGS